METQKIQYREMTNREIKDAKEFLKKVEKIGKQKKYSFEISIILENKKRGWKTQIGDPVYL